MRDRGEITVYLELGHERDREKQRHRASCHECYLHRPDSHRANPTLACLATEGRMVPITSGLYAGSWIVYDRYETWLDPIWLDLI